MVRKLVKVILVIMTIVAIIGSTTTNTVSAFGCNPDEQNTVCP